MSSGQGDKVLSSTMPPVFMFLFCIFCTVPSEKLRATTPIPSNTLVYEWAKNAPLFDTQNMLAGKYVTYVLGYRHYLNQDWRVGIGINFRSFIKKKDEQELAFLTLNHETLYSIRLSHPTYLLVGPKFSYIIPTQQTRLPIRKDPKFETEIAFAISSTLLHQINKKLAVSFRIDRWRGTKTNKFHAFETAAGIGFTLGE